MEKYCLNCGHDCHCGSDCIKEYDKGTKIVCCVYCRCNKKEQKLTINEEKIRQANMQSDNIEMEKLL